MCKGRYMLHISDFSVVLYELTADEAIRLWNSPFRGMHITDANMSENHIALVADPSGMFERALGATVSLVIARIDSLRVSINIPLDENLNPSRVVLQENDNKDGWIYVAYARGCIEQYAYGYVFDGEGGNSSVLSVAPSGRIMCGGVGEKLIEISCHKDKVAALFRTEERKLIVRVFSVSPFNMIRELPLDDFYCDPPSVKKRRVVNCERIYAGMIMDESRLVCYDNKSHRVHTWKFSE